MNDDVRKLEGSWRRDRFKFLHKRLNRTFYGCDLDFVPASKNPPGIVAFLDYKTPGEKVTFAEVLVYNDLLRLHPIFLVIGDDPERGPFEVREYLGGDWGPNPPVTHQVFRCRCSDWSDLSRWESQIRREYENKFNAQSN